MQHSMMEKTFSEWSWFYVKKKTKSLNLLWWTLQMGFKKLLDDARNELVEDKKWTGFKQAWSEVQELAVKMIQEMHEHKLLKKKRFLLFFLLYTLIYP